MSGCSVLIGVFLSAGDGSGREHRGRGGEGGRPPAGPPPHTCTCLAANSSPPMIPCFFFFLSPEEEEEAASEVCAPEGLQHPPGAGSRPLAAGRPPPPAPTITVPSMLLQAEVKGAHGPTPGKGSKVAGLHPPAPPAAFRTSG